uniref:PQQ_3 domain-containing protein n=1 Tax=Heterorhabditis bacteriophora TaxID=37862 RepID=A0A1I7WY30_HETBA
MSITCLPTNCHKINHLSLIVQCFIYRTNNSVILKGQASQYIHAISISIHFVSAEEVHTPFSPSFGTVLVSTIDGHLRALDSQSGTIKWTIQEEPVLRAPNVVKQGFTFLPNPQDGSLYVLKEGTLKKLPFTVPQLVHVSPCKGSDGVLYAGSKKDVWFGIDPITGTKVDFSSSRYHAI